MAVRLLTNHGHALLCVARDPGMRLREIAGCIGVSERAAHTIVCDLEQAGYLTRHRRGRRNHYEVHRDALAVHELVGSLVRALGDGA